MVKRYFIDIFPLQLFQGYLKLRQEKKKAPVSSTLFITCSESVKLSKWEKTVFALCGFCNYSIFI